MLNKNEVTSSQDNRKNEKYLKEVRETFTQKE